MTGLLRFFGPIPDWSGFAGRPVSYLGATGEYVVDNGASPTLRLHAFADHFTLTDATGALLMESDYALATPLANVLASGDTLWAALTAGLVRLDFSGSSGPVTTQTLEPGTELIGSSFGDVLRLRHDHATIDAGDGDDNILIAPYFGEIHGGAGMDTLDMAGLTSFATQFEVGLVITGFLDAKEIFVDGFEYIRGSALNDAFHGDGTGYRFEGAAGPDTFASPGAADIIDYSREYERGGSHGIVANMSSLTLASAADLPAYVGQAGRALVSSLLVPNSTELRTAVCDTFGETDEVDGRFIFVGSPAADFYFGGAGADTFNGVGGDDCFAGNGGDDVFDGGAGNDIVYLRHARSSYAVTKNGDDFVIADNSVADSDGIDRYSGVELFSFNGALIAADALVTAPLVITTKGHGSSASFSPKEGTVTVTTVAASGDGVTWSLHGSDAALFKLSSGTLKFKQAPDYEAAKDEGRNNNYQLTLEATGSGVSTTQALVIEVKNVKGNVLSGSGAGEMIDAIHTIGGKGATGEEDKIDGRSGRDAIKGEGGKDTLIGGLGNDTLTGGAGADKFVFNAALGPANIDTIRDFTHDLDRIQLDNAVMASLGATGALAWAKFWAAPGATKAHDASDRVVYDKTTGKLYFDDDGKGGHAAVQIALLSNKPLLDAGDIAVV